MKRLLLFIILSAFTWAAQAQTNEALDTINIRKELKLNDYAMIGQIITKQNRIRFTFTHNKFIHRRTSNPKASRFCATSLPERTLE